MVVIHKASWMLVLMILLVVRLPIAFAQESADPKSVYVSASERYKAGLLHRISMGEGYRDLWEAKILLPVLALASEGGGLTPVGRFGGLQTPVLAFRGADGRSYSFRGTDKDPSSILEPDLYHTIIRDIVQDQMAAQHPAGPIVAGVLSEAAGVLTLHERLVVMPADPALGKYREEFAGKVGSFYEYPLPRTTSRRVAPPASRANLIAASTASAPELQ